MTSLITHLHDFVREVKLTEEEWINAIQFLTAVGQKCTDKRQEFILLSDTLGVSVLVITLNHPAEQGSAESTVLGPFYWEGAPDLPLGSNLAVGVKGEPAFYSGRVLSADGQPIRERAARCLVRRRRRQLRHADARGCGHEGARHASARMAQGRYWFRSIRPTYYPVPTDGPVGAMLRKMGRHPYRPGHIHMIVSAPGHAAVTTHLFVADSEYLDSDAVFGMKESLVAKFNRHPAGKAPTGETVDTPFYTVEYDFRLKRASAAAAA